MKKLFIVANWKSNMTTLEAKNWLQEISNIKYQISNIEEKEIIICPSFTLLSNLKSAIESKLLPFKLGAQDISPYNKGAYTGEVNAEQIKEFADYVIIGHSERRQYFSETEEILEKKVAMAQKYALSPIFCLQEHGVQVPPMINIVAYEPVFAIGTGNPDTAENANKIASEIKKARKVQHVLYGGSVTKDNVASFTQKEHIDGVLVGGASLNPSEFLAIIQHA